MKHKHHNPPRHRAGDHDNVVEVTTTQHAMFHYCEWRLHGLREDFIAWKGLSQAIGKEELFLERSALGGSKGAGKPKPHEHGKAISEAVTKLYEEDPTYRHRVSKAMEGNTNSKNHSSEDYKKKQSEAMKAAWARRKAKQALQ